jgi:hypothetical protein
MTANSPPSSLALDHLLLGAADLDYGIAWVERRTGVKAASGGSHPGVGTCNALLSLGRRQYLEIIAPDPAQSAFHFHLDLRALQEPRLITWAAAAGLDAVAQAARAAGYSLSGPREGSRIRGDGKTLRWKTLRVLHPWGGNGLDPVPFFIEWAAGSEHPSQDAPRGCELQRFEIEHPDPPAVLQALHSLGIQAAVRPNTVIRLIAALQTPRGRVELS